MHGWKPTTVVAASLGILGKLKLEAVRYSVLLHMEWGVRTARACGGTALLPSPSLVMAYSSVLLSSIAN